MFSCSNDPDTLYKGSGLLCHIEWAFRISSVTWTFCLISMLQFRGTFFVIVNGFLCVCVCVLYLLFVTLCRTLCIILQIKRFIFVCFTWYECICVPCEPGGHKGQKRALHPLQLELQMVGCRCWELNFCPLEE